MAFASTGALRCVVRYARSNCCCQVKFVWFVGMNEKTFTEPTLQPEISSASHCFNRRELVGMKLRQGYPPDRCGATYLLDKVAN